MHFMQLHTCHSVVPLSEVNASLICLSLTLEFLYYIGFVDSLFMQVNGYVHTPFNDMPCWKPLWQALTCWWPKGETGCPCHSKEGQGKATPTVRDGYTGYRMLANCAYFWNLLQSSKFVSLGEQNIAFHNFVSMALLME